MDFIIKHLDIGQLHQQHQSVARVVVGQEWSGIKHTKDISYVNRDYKCSHIHKYIYIMFILRRITSEGNEMNDCIGDCYHIVMQERNEDEFKKSLEVTKTGVDLRDGLYGFVIYTLTDTMIHYPLYKKSVYFIMMSNGQTFANITYR